MVSIELDRVTFSYPGGVHGNLFVNLSLKVSAGEWLALVGPPAAGKTTLIKLLQGLLQPQAGRILINGSPLPAGQLNYCSTCVFSNPENQIVSPVVAEDVGFNLENAGFHPEIIRTRVQEALAWVGLQERARDFSHHLSGGEQQRLILAGALASGAGCLLLDDVLSMVDGMGRARIMRLLADLHRRRSITIVQATYSLAEALWAERLVAIENGKPVFSGPPQDFLQEQELVEHLGFEVPPGGAPGWPAPQTA